jgi:hypothetical protein
VAKAHITKAHRVRWAVGLKISSGGCQQNLYDFCSSGTGISGAALQAARSIVVSGIAKNRMLLVGLSVTFATRR